MRGSRGLIGAVLAFLVVAFVAWFAFSRLYHPGMPADVIAADAKLSVVDVTSRELDGAPAIVVTFSIPLAKRSVSKDTVELYEDVRQAPAPKKTDAENDSDNDSGDDADNADTGAVTAVAGGVSDADLSSAKRVAIAPVVAENPRLIAFAPIKPKTRYIVRIKPGLVAANGQELGAEARWSLAAPAVSPAYYFASNGMVLPAKENGGLPVTTVNVPEVDIQFLRVRDDQLPAFLDRAIAGAHSARKTDDDESEEDATGDDTPYNYHRSFKGAVEGYDLDSLHRMTDSVYQARFVTEQQANKRSVTFIPVEDIAELKTPGVYIAVMTQPNRFRYEFQTTYFYVSDLGLQVRSFDKTADAYVSSLIDGKPIRGAELSYIDQQGAVLAHATTDGDGHANFPERPKGARVLLARLNKQISLLTLKEPALDLSEYQLSGLTYKPVHLFAYSGRDLYRPGESFDVSVLARDADGKPVAPQPIQITVKRPDGQDQIKGMVKPDSRFPGFYSDRIDIPADAPTGTWTIEYRSDPADKVAGTVMAVHVEEFLPERMKLDLSANPDPKANASELALSVHGAYLYGAPASGNTVKTIVTYERAVNPLAAKLAGFSFGDAREDAAHSRKELDDTTLDANGKTDVTLDLTPVVGKHSPTTVRATVSLLESGGRPVIRNLERTVWPADVLIGIRPLFTGDYANEDSPADFEVVRADREGTLKGEAGLPVKLFREDRNYYWRFDDQRGWNSGFTESDELVSTQSLSIPEGARGKLRLPVHYGRYRIEIFDSATGQTLVYRFYAGWSAHADEDAGVRPDRVALKLDRPAYKPGDTLKVEIKPPHDGEALVTVEGDRTLYIKRTSVKESGTTLSIPLDKSWARHDLYLTAMVLRPGNAGDRVTPTRALGIEHIALDRTDRRLAVTLEAPQKVLPETTVHVKLKVPDAHGEQAVVTLSAVDVGILNVTGFPSPDPIASFFGTMRYGAELRDVYGRLIEKFAGHKGKLRFGGDAGVKPTRDVPKKVKLVDLFSGPVALNAEGEADIPVQLPDFNGTLRLMAVVATADRFGSKDAEMTVAAPVIAELATPRFLSFGDSATIALDVHNLSGHAETLNVAVTSGDGLSVHDVARAVTLKDGEKQTLRFGVDAGQNALLVPVSVRLQSSDIKISRDFALEVKAPTPPQTVTHRFIVKPGDTVDLHPAEIGDFYKDTLTAHVIASSTPPIDVRAAIRGLLEYPYGCVEQTTSTAYPFVFVDADAATRYGIKPYSRPEREAILSKVFAKLAALQAPEGGFSLWGGASNVEVWLTAYVVNFLEDARAAGFDVPDAMEKKALDYLFLSLQKGAAQLSGHAKAPPGQGDDSYWGHRIDADNRHFDPLAYAALALAREKRAPLATLKQLFEARANADSSLSLTNLAIALKLMGDDPRSATAAAEAVKKHRPQGGWWWGEYGTELRDSAMSYALLTQYHAAPGDAADLLGNVIGALQNHSRYYSTQEQLALFLAAENLETIKGAAWQGKLSLAAGDKALGGTTPGTSEVSAAELAAVKFTNTGDAPVFLEIGLHGFPLKIAPSSDIFVSREVLAADGTALPDGPLKVGDGVLIHVRAQSHDLRTNVLVIDRIPAGLEIENSNIAQGEGLNLQPIHGINPADAMSSTRITHTEFREDRFVAAVRLGWFQPIDLFYRARVVTPGKFTAPGAYAEDMYTPSIYGVSTQPAPLVVTDGAVTTRAQKVDAAAAAH